MSLGRAAGDQEQSEHEGEVIAHAEPSTPRTKKSRASSRIESGRDSFTTRARSLEYLLADFAAVDGDARDSLVARVEVEKEIVPEHGVGDGAGAVESKVRDGEEAVALVGEGEGAGRSRTRGAAVLDVYAGQKIRKEVGAAGACFVAGDGAVDVDAHGFVEIARGNFYGVLDVAPVDGDVGIGDGGLVRGCRRRGENQRGSDEKR